MSDLEAQRRAYNAWGKNDYVPRAPGGATNLTPAQRALADSFHGFLLASAIDRLAHEGKRYFSRGSLGGSSGVMAAVQDGETLGLWKANADKPYWTHTSLTNAWVNTALALHDERVRTEQARTKGGQRG